jgi:hypothetical protein
MATDQPKSNVGRGLAIATLVAIFGTILVNTLSNFFPPGGENVGQIANTILDGVRIIPANYAFAIWGLIYLGIIAYGFYQWGANQRQDLRIRRVNKFLIVACIAQIIWIFLFTLQYFTLSILAMVAILLALMGAYRALYTDPAPARRQRRWFARYPFSLYLAWISVATVVNIAAALYTAGWNQWGLSDIGWTVVMLVVTAVIAAWVIGAHQDIPFTLVFVWAYGAIAVSNANVPAIWMTAIGASLILLVLLATKRLQASPRSEQAQL